jgi:hypothetical protein
VQSIKSGWKYIWQTPVVLSVMALDMFAVLFGGAVAMLPAYADQILHVGSEGLGLLRAAPAVGAVVVGLTLAVRPMQVMRGPVLLAVVTGFGLCIIGFGLSTSFLWAMIFLILSGGFDNVSLVMRAAILQVTTPATMRGRVSGINSMFIISSNELGAFESGVARPGAVRYPRRRRYAGRGCGNCMAVAAAATYEDRDAGTERSLTGLEQRTAAHARIAVACNHHHIDVGRALRNAFGQKRFRFLHDNIENADADFLRREFMRCNFLAHTLLRNHVFDRA